MTHAIVHQLDALRIALGRLEALGCEVERFRAWRAGSQPLVNIVRPTRALLDWLDSQQIRIGTTLGSSYAAVDGCAVCWSLAEWTIVEEGEHIELDVSVRSDRDRGELST